MSGICVFCIETHLMIMFQCIQEAGLLEEFNEFYSSRGYENLFESFKEFGKLHPDKFYIPEENEQYEKLILIKEITCT